MVACWLMCDRIDDSRDECHRSPPVFISLDELMETGVEYFHVPLSNELNGLAEISKSRGYSYRDEIVISAERLPNYGECIRRFFDEHLHKDEEIRYIRAGRGYFDVRSKDDQWIRILSEPGDLLVLPAGIYHRFSVTKENYVEAIRLFRGEPLWTPFNRSDSAVEEMEVRKNYLAG
uniref:Acireductone dioxygenase n=1 Tax=Globodera rostochiensis TaxID=31243 RepID=A0A914H990_GLORO